MNGIYSPFLGDYDFSPYGAAFGYEVENICQTVFLIQNGMVTGWKWRGNDCVAINEKKGKPCMVSFFPNVVGK